MIAAALSICMLCFQPASLTQNHADHLPSRARRALDRRFQGWKFAEVSQEVRQFFRTDRKEELPHLIRGDFDGNKQSDYAALIWKGKVRNSEGKAIGPRSFLVVFLRTGVGYHMYVIKEPDGEYLSLAKKGTRDYNYNEQKEITYTNDTILTVIFEKGSSSYVYENGRFRSFVSSD
jgi:hypothetical protein